MKLNWNSLKIKKWLYKTGMEHIHDGLYEEGAKLVYESKWGDAWITRNKFERLMRDVCWWDINFINEIISNIHCTTLCNPS